MALSGRHVEKTGHSTYFQALCGSQKLRVSICIGLHMKFSVAQNRQQGVLARHTLDLPPPKKMNYPINRRAVSYLNKKYLLNTVNHRFSKTQILFACIYHPIILPLLHPHIGTRLSRLADKFTTGLTQTTA